MVETVEDLFEERGEQEKVWDRWSSRHSNAANPVSTRAITASAARPPMLEEASARKPLELEHDEVRRLYHPQLCPRGLNRSPDVRRLLCPA